MSVTWTKVWAVRATSSGAYLIEKEASNFDALQGDITLRPVADVASTRQGWQKHSRPNVMQQWATTPAGAIEKYLAGQRALIGNLEASITLARLQMAEAEQLKEKL